LQRKWLLSLTGCLEEQALVLNRGLLLERFQLAFLFLTDLWRAIARQSPLRLARFQAGQIKFCL